MSEPTPTGTCRECGRVFTLTSRGDLRHHGAPKTFPPERCPGAGQEPRTEHRVSEEGNAFGGYNCLCGRPWFDTLGGCPAMPAGETGQGQP